MADDLEKTEEPTPKKIEDAKKEGNVPKSMDTSGFVTLLVAVVAFVALTGWIVDRLETLYRYYIDYVGVELTPRLLVEITTYTVIQIFIMVLPLALPVALAGMLGAWAQFGFIFTTKPLVPSPSRWVPYSPWLSASFWGLSRSSFPSPTLPCFTRSSGLPTGPSSWRR